MHHPTLSEFQQKAREGNLIPVYREILADEDTPVSAYERLRAAGFTHTFLLESVEGGEHLARYSFLGGLPPGREPQALFTGSGRRVEVVSGDGTTVHEDVEPLSVVEAFMARYRPVRDPRLPVFVGGAVGYLGYDAVAQFDRVPLAEAPGLGFPDMVYLLVDTLVIFDRARHAVVLVACAHIPDGGDPAAAHADALERIGQLEAAMRTAIPRRLLDVDAAGGGGEATPVSNFEEADFRAAVERGKEYIRAGDIIQVVLSQRFERAYAGDPLHVYRALRTINPSPYMFCLEFGPHRLVGSSPEVHVRCEEGEVQIRPIAGTRKRKADPTADRAMEEELLADPKERAEHVMLVDLARNDIGRVCRPGSVEVTEFMVIERYSHVMHIVSHVRGELAEGRNAYDLMRATFPAGTVSGAPKIRAMEIIAEMEPDRRGAYAGAVGYFGFDGNHDSCIAIRTVLLDGGGRACVQAGAGVVADSDPALEHLETRNKARGMLRALDIAAAYEAQTESEDQTEGRAGA